MQAFHLTKINLCCFSVQDNSSVGDGTYFLQEYMIPRGSNSFCLYDTRSLVDNASDNVKMIRQWITYGVRHGELVIRSDSSTENAFHFVGWIAFGLVCNLHILNYFTP